MVIDVQKTPYGALLTDKEFFEGMSVNQEDIPQLIKDLQALLPTPEIDHNTVAMLGDNKAVAHTYNPECPQGCYGQLKACVYNKE